MYGKTFPLELKAAGLVDLPFSWTPDGSFIFDDSLSAEQRAAIEAVAAAHSPEATTPLMEIADKEAANPITHRMLRELALSVAQIAGAVTGKAPEENQAVRDIQALDLEIARLRDQAKAQGLIP